MPIRVRETLGRLRAIFLAKAGVHPLLPALVALASAMLLALDPFGVGAASHVRSEQATLRIAAPFYEPSGRVTVILIDDEYVTRRAAGWPLSYGEQGRLIRSILAYKPAVLLIDLVYPHRHAKGATVAPNDEANALLDPFLNPPVRPDTKPDTTPIIFTAMALTPEALEREGRCDYCFCAEKFNPEGDDDLLDPSSIQPELLDELEKYRPNTKGSRVHRAYIRWSGCGDRYPLLLGGNPKTVTPAFAAYRAFCAGHPTEAQCSSSQPDSHPADYLHPMIVRSGAFPPATQRFAYDESTCQKTGRDARGKVSFLEKLWASFVQLSLGMFKDLRTDPNKNLALPCAAVTVLPLSTLQGATKKEWDELVGGNVVLLGASLTGHPDFVNTPVHHQIPGVVWHGMAVDNLLSRGANYFADRYETLQLAAQIVLIGLFAYLFPFIVWFIEHRRAKQILASVSLAVWLTLAAMHFAYGHTATALIALGIGIALDLTKPTASAGYFAAVLFAAVCSAIAVRWGWLPGNWFGLVIVVIAFAHTIKPYYRGEERKRFPHTASILGAIFRIKETAHE